MENHRHNGNNILNSCLLTTSMKIMKNSNEKIKKDNNNHHHNNKTNQIMDLYEKKKKLGGQYYLNIENNKNYETKGKIINKIKSKSPTDDRDENENNSQENNDKDTLETIIEQRKNMLKKLPIDKIKQELNNKKKCLTDRTENYKPLINKFHLNTTRDKSINHINDEPSHRNTKIIRKIEPIHNTINTHHASKIDEKNNIIYQITELKTKGRKFSTHQKPEQKKEINEWFENQAKLSHRIALYEKDQAGFLYGNNNDMNYNNDKYYKMELYKELNQYEEDKKNNLRIISQQINHIRGNITKLSLFIKENIINEEKEYKINHTTKEMFEKKIQDIETEISTFRTSERISIEKLILEQKSITKELEICEKNIENWETNLDEIDRSYPLNNNKLVFSKRKASIAARFISVFKGMNGSTTDLVHNAENEIVMNDMNKEDKYLERIQYINDFIFEHRETCGGWRPEEHDIFIKLLSNVKITDDLILSVFHPQTLKKLFLSSFPNEKLPLNELKEVENDDIIDSIQDNNDEKKKKYEARVANLISKSINLLPNKSNNSIRGHLQWYAIDLYLLNEKKIIITLWRNFQNVKKKLLIQDNTSTTNNNDNIIQKDENNNNNINTLGKYSKKLIKEDNEKKKKLIEWKEKKDKEGKINEINKKYLDKQIKDEVKRKKIQENIEKKQKLAMYKLKKEEEKYMNNLKKQQEDEKKKKFIKKISCKENMDKVASKAILKAKEEREKKIKNNEEFYIPPRPKSAIYLINEKIKTDPKRLIQPTQASEAKSFSKQEVIQAEEKRFSLAAHNTFIPGAKAATQLKIKSFGHIPIQPRAIPAWRKDLV